MPKPILKCSVCGGKAHYSIQKWATVYLIIPPKGFEAIDEITDGESVDYCVLCYREKYDSKLR